MLSIWHQSLVVLVSVEVSIGQVGRQEPLGRLCPPLPSGHSDTAPHHAEQGQGQGPGLPRWLPSTGGHPCRGISWLPLTWLHPRSCSPGPAAVPGHHRLGRAGWEHGAHQFTEDTDSNMVNVIFAITSRSPQPWGALGCPGVQGLGPSRPDPGLGGIRHPVFLGLSDSHLPGVS